MAALTIVLAGGGSAGHVNPMLATAHILRERGHKVHLVGTAEGLEVDLVPSSGFDLTTIERVPFPRRPGKALMTFPSRYAKAVTQAGRLLDESGADVALGFGGFASTPVYTSAHKRGLPVVIHEQNAKPGLANKYGARFAQAVGLTFASTPLRAKVGRTEHVGLPLRAPIYNLACRRLEDPHAGREEASARLGLDPSLPTLLVTGGSLGAAHLNSVLGTVACEIVDCGFQVLHLTGRGKSASIAAATSDLSTYHVREYLVEMEDAYATADLVLARAGAGSVAELSALGLPAFFVPLAIGNGEQELNAADVLAAGGGHLVRDKDFTVATVRRELLPLLSSPHTREEMGKAAKSVGCVDGAFKLARLVEEVCA